MPVTTRRLLIVMAPTVAACSGVALAVGPRYPFAALLFIAGILCVSSAALPAPAWSWWFRAAGKALRVPWAWLRAARPGASGFRWNVLRGQPELAQAPVAAAAEHALWIDRLRIVAQVQKDAALSHPEDCFCACGIPVRDLERFRDEIEFIAWQMQQRERERRRGQ